jgi:hypothetical protein
VSLDSSMADCRLGKSIWLLSSGAAAGLFVVAAPVAHRMSFRELENNQEGNRFAPCVPSQTVRHALRAE